MRSLSILATALAALACTSTPRINVVLLTIDTCRSDRLSCYGYDQLDTRGIDGVAEEGVLFEEARTCVPITLPSHTSILTGSYPSTHGVRENGGYRAADSLLTMTEILKGEGYKTAAFVGAFPLDSRFNLDQGFDYYGDNFEKRGGEETTGPGGFSIFYPQRPASEVNDEFFAWLKDQGSEPFFAWLHYFDPHQPFEPRPPYDVLCVGRPYDAEIAFVDECVGQLASRLRAQGLLDRTVFVITADHGEALGEHGEISHALLLHEPTLRVPLIIRCPPEMGLRGRITSPVRTVDLAATILDLIGVGRTISGTSLVPLMRGQHPVVETGHLFETYYGRLHFGWSVLFGYDRDEWRLVQGPRRELYDLSNDPKEAQNLIDQYPDRAAELEQIMFQELGVGTIKHSIFVDRDAGTMERLRALGYVGTWEEAGPAESLFTGPDPRDMMDAHRLFDEARAYVHRGMWPEAIDAYRATIDADPGNGDARIGLAQAMLQVGDARAAVETAREITVQREDLFDGWLLLARLELWHGDAQQAIDAAHRALAEGADPVDGWLVVAQAHESMGHVREAVDAYARALEDDESNLKAHLGRARSLAGLGENESARLEFQETLRFNPYFAPAQYNYGVFLLNGGSASEARECFQRAVLMAPGYVPAHHALALLLEQEGRLEEAIPHFEAVVMNAPEEGRRASAQQHLDRIRSALSSNRTAS